MASKNARIAALWPRGFVHESNLTEHIWLIRKALSDGGDHNRYIETIPKLGYRFIAPLSFVDVEDARNDELFVAKSVAAAPYGTAPQPRARSSEGCASDGVVEPGFTKGVRFI